eukprot:6476260-Amphidinium_carterae.1
MQRRYETKSYNDFYDSMIKRNAERQKRRAAGLDADPDEPIPQAPTVPNDFEPFTSEQRETIAEYTEAFNHYRRALQYTLTKVTKGEPYKFVQLQQLKRI